MGKIKLSDKEEDLVTSTRAGEGEKVNSPVAGEQERVFQREKSEER